MCRVLLCDDVAAYRFVVKAVLDLDPHIQVVAEASHGGEAIERTREFLPDVILLDVAMPIVDGLEALPRIRALVPDAQIAMLSGFSSEHVKQQAKELGADHYAEKGATPDELMELVRELCSRAA